MVATMLHGSLSRLTLTRGILSRSNSILEKLLVTKISDQSDPTSRGGKRQTAHPFVESFDSFLAINPGSR